MSIRRLIVEVELEGLNVAAFCAEHHVSRWLFYDLRRRYARDGAAALEPRSRAPRRVANRTPAGIEERIVEMRKALLDDGWDAGPDSIHDRLIGAGVDGVPSAATIWRVLARHGFIVAEPAKRPKAAMRRFVAERANECWQFDDTAWQLADATAVKIINVVDDCSRVLVASVAVRICTANAVFAALLDGASRWGLPERVLCDNAKAHHALHDALAELGVATRHSRPFHPQTCGKVERLHQTLKQHLAAQDPAATINELQAQLDHFTDAYNTTRPHRSLDRHHPADVWAATPKSGPANRALHAATTIHHVAIATNGVAHTGSYAIGIGRRYARQSATIVITGTAGHAFIDAHLIRAFTLDPTRRSQPSRPTTYRQL